MTKLSNKIKNFLEVHGKDRLVDVTPVPKSRSSLSVGDIVAFDYRPEDPISHDSGSRIALLVRPIFRYARTRNLHMTCVKIPVSADFGPDSLDQLYKNRDLLPEGSYRTYILKNIIGPLYKVSIE